jgi:hypothetical protein
MGDGARVGGEQKCIRGFGREGVHLEGPGSHRKNNIKVELTLIRCDGVD